MADEINTFESETNSQIISDYENAEEIFNICKSEYDNEKIRTNTIDSKISIIAAIVMGAIALIISIIDFSAISQITFQNGKDVAVFLMKLIVSFGSLASFVVSLIILLICIITRKYESIDCYTYLQVEKLKEKQCYYQLMCANKYAECCKHNREINEKRCKFYNISIVFLLSGIVLLIIFIILKSIL